MKIFSSQHIAALLAGATAFTAGAEDLRTEINVDRTVVPVQRPATRLQTLSPSLITPKVDTRRLNMTEYSSASEFAPTFNKLEPGSYPALKPLSPYRGYAAIGYFPAFNLGASAGYRIVNTEKTRLGAWLQYDGYSYNSHIAAGGDERPGVNNNTFTIAADFAQRFGTKSHLMADVAYTRAALGLPSDANPSQKQGINLADAKLAWWSTAGKVGYHANLAFSHTGLTKDIAFSNNSLSAPDLNPASENRISFTAGAVSQNSRGVWFGAEASADFLHHNNGLTLTHNNDPLQNLTGDAFEYIWLLQPEHATNGIISVKPYFGYTSRTVNARIGIDLDITTGTSSNGKAIHVSPDVLLNWNPSTQTSLYARFTGGEHFNSLRSLYEVSPFAPGPNIYVNSYTPVKARVGFIAGPFAGATAEIFAGYEATRGVPMPAIISYLRLPVEGGYTSYRDYAGFMPVNLSGWDFGVRLGYAWRSMFKASAGFHLLPSSYSHATSANRDRARYIADATIEFKPMEQMSFELGYEFRGGRKYYALDLRESSTSAVYDRREMKMRNVSDLSFGGRYAFTDAFTVFLRVENILSRHVEELPWMTGAGIHGLAGVQLKF